MDTIDWKNQLQLDEARKFFDKYVSAWNPYTESDRQNRLHYNLNDDPCILNTQQILSLDPLTNYEQIVNTVQ